MPLSADPIEVCYKSVIRSVVDLIDELNSTGRFTPIAYHDWESRGDEDKLPPQTLIGTDGFSFNENGGLWLVRYALAISSYRDQNLLNEIEMIGEIHQRFGQGKKINLLDMTDASTINELVVVDFEMLPMAQSELRNYRTIGLEVRRTGTDG